MRNEAKAEIKLIRKSFQSRPPLVAPPSKFPWRPLATSLPKLLIPRYGGNQSSFDLLTISHLASYTLCLCLHPTRSLELRDFFFLIFFCCCFAFRIRHGRVCNLVWYLVSTFVSFSGRHGTRLGFTVGVSAHFVYWKQSSPEGRHSLR